MTAAAPSDFSKKTFKTFLLRVLTQLFAIGAGIIIARSLGPAGKGYYTYAAAVLTLLVTLGGGASAAVARQYGRMKVPSGVVYSAMVRYFFIVVVPASAVLVAVALIVHQPVLLAPAFAFPFAYVNQVSIAFSLADGDVNLANIQGLTVAAALTIVAAVLCYGFHLGVTAILTGWIGITAAVCAYSLARIDKYAHNFGCREERNRAFREQTQFGARVTFNQLLALLNYQVDIFIIMALLGHASLGKYSVAVGLGAMMWQLSRPLTVTSYGSITSGSPQEAARMTVLCVRHAIFNVGAACMVLAVLGPWIIRLVYGPAFGASGVVLQVLLPGVIAYCTVPFFSQYFTLQLGKPGINTAVIGGSTLICATITILLIHRFGIVAGAIGTSVSYTAAFFSLLRHLLSRSRRRSAIAGCLQRHGSAALPRAGDVDSVAYACPARRLISAVSAADVTPCAPPSG